MVSRSRRQDLSVRHELHVKGGCTRGVHAPKLRHPPRLKMKMGPEAKLSGAENHASAKIGSKAEDRNKQNEANDKVRRKLVVMNGPVGFPFPVPERRQQVNAIVEKQQDQRPKGIVPLHAIRHARR